MPSITTDQGTLHYEAFGRGQPVILLHGYQGSWGLWRETMEHLGESRRTYALDFWGFGESGARRASYAVEDFVTLVDQFMGQLGILRAPIVGHSMGGTVALLFAGEFTHRVERVVVVSAPIVGASLRFFPRVFGYRPVGWLAYHGLWAYRASYRILARSYSRDPDWPNMMDHGVTHTTLGAFFASISSLRATDLRPLLKRVSAPVLAMYGVRDNVVDPDQGRMLQAGIPAARTHHFPLAGHFIMLDEPGGFRNLLEDFLDATNAR